MYDLFVIVLLVIGFWLLIKYLSDRYERMSNYKCSCCGQQFCMSPERKKEWFDKECAAICDLCYSNNKGIVRHQMQINIDHQL